MNRHPIEKPSVPMVMAMSLGLLAAGVVAAIAGLLVLAAAGLVIFGISRRLIQLMRWTRRCLARPGGSVFADVAVEPIDSARLTAEVSSDWLVALDDSRLHTGSPLPDLVEELIATAPTPYSLEVVRKCLRH